MNTLTRKQREIKARESRILEVAREQFVRDGYHGLSMDRIATTLEYAKGTIYNHFSCKEEIMIALANQALEKRTQMFRDAAALPGQSRERLAAIGGAAEWFVQRFPNYFAVEQLIRSTSIWDKTSEKRRNFMQLCETRCMEVVAGVVRDGLASRDLELADDATPESVVFGLWSMSFGGYSIIATSSLPELGIADPYEMVRQNLNAMLDGIGWQPLSSEVDYGQVYDRVQKQLFSDEQETAAA